MIRRIPLVGLVLLWAVATCSAQDEWPLPAPIQTRLDAATKTVAGGNERDVTAAIRSLQDLKLDDDGREQVASTLLEAINERQEAKQYSVALAAYRALYEVFPSAPSAPKAMYNAGLTLEALKRPKQAIAEYLRIFPSGADDKEPGESLMEAYRNYRHDAQARMAGCLGAVGRKAEALIARLDAYHIYPYQSWCGTCSNGAYETIRQQVAVAYLDLAGRRPAGPSQTWKPEVRAEVELIAEVVDVVPSSEVKGPKGKVRFVELDPRVYLETVARPWEEGGQAGKAREARALLRHYPSNKPTQRLTDPPALDSDALAEEREARKELLANLRKLAKTRRQAESGDPAAMVALAEMLIDGDQVVAAPAEGLRWLERAADKGSQPAMLRLGNIYRTGRARVEVDYAVAARWWGRALRTKDGAPVVQDLDRMVAQEESAATGLTADLVPHLSRLARAGSAPATRLLVRMYLQGAGVPRDPARALHWTLELANLGDPAAQLAIARKTADSKRPGDLDGAVFWYVQSLFGRVAGDLPWEEAQKELEDLLRARPALARQLVHELRLTAERYPVHQLLLGRLLALGLGSAEEDRVEQAIALNFEVLSNPNAKLRKVASTRQTRLLHRRPFLAALAEATARKRAEAGDLASMHRYGWMVRRGYGTEQDPVAALRWHRREARRLGSEPCEEAAELVSRLEKTELERARQAAKQTPWDEAYLGWLLMKLGHHLKARSALKRAAERGAALARVLRARASGPSARGILGRLRPAAQAGDREATTLLVECLAERDLPWVDMARWGVVNGNQTCLNRLLGREGMSQAERLGLLRRGARMGVITAHLELERLLRADPTLRLESDP